MTKQDQKTIKQAFDLIMRTRHIGMPGCQFNQDSAAVVKKLRTMLRRKTS